MYNKENTYFDANGRMYRKEFFEKKIPIHTFIYGKLVGKFHSDKKKTNDERAEYFDFKIYEAEVEILYKGAIPKRFVADEQSIITINTNQLPEKIYFFEKREDEKIYYNLNIQNPEFHNFKFIPLYQQNDDDEAFGTVEGEIYGFLTRYETEKWYKKRYRKIKLISKKDEKVETDKEKTTKINYNVAHRRLEKIFSSINSRVEKIPFINNFSRCFRNIIIALAVMSFSFLMGFTPIAIIAFLWLFYLINKCYFNWFRYIAYFLGFLFLLGLVFSLLNTNWDGPEPYIPKTDNQQQTKPQLVKIIRLISGERTEDLIYTHKMIWYGYNGEKYEGEYNMKHSDYKTSIAEKNAIPYQTPYRNMLIQVSRNDENQLQGLYQMFDKINANKPKSKALFAEMIVSFVQHIPYQLVMEQSCNPNDYPEKSIRQLIAENRGKCVPNQKFGITTPVEFMVTQKGDCDSRTLLLYTILKHYNYDVAILSSDVYMHSILAVSLPYNGIKYNALGKQYILWETTDIYKPGNIPVQITNLNHWELTLN